MKITRENYESYFIDYIDGTLDVADMDDFIDFLQSNPDLKSELSLFSAVSVQSGKQIFDKKEALYKHRYDSVKEFNQAAIADVENDISENEKKEFEEYLSSHPDKYRDYRLFTLTKLSPDNSIIFHKKNSLVHIPVAKRIIMWSARIAAVLIVVVSVVRFAWHEVKNKNQDVIITSEQKIEENNLPDRQINAPVLEREFVQAKEVMVQTKKIIRQKSAVAPLEIVKQAETNTQFKTLNSEERFGKIQRMNSIKAQMGNTEHILALVPILSAMENETANVEENRLLGDIIKEKTGLNNLTFRNIARSGLNLASILTKEKFNYSSDKEGNITKVNLDSKVLAFSIPTGKNSGKE